MFDREGFRAYYFANIGQSPGAFNTYSSYLKRMSTILGDLNEKITSLGRQELLALVDTQQNEPFISHRSQCRAILNAYAQFVEDDEFDEEVAEKEVAAAAVATVFSYEKELQAAIRAQLETLEPGLTIIDGGAEATFDTGRSDILARDAKGCAVVIELKAGKCPKGAIEQVLGYAQDLRARGAPAVRPIIVVGEFSLRMMAAAKMIPVLELRTYHLSLQFAKVDEE